MTLSTRSPRETSQRNKDHKGSHLRIKDMCERPKLGCSQNRDLGTLRHLSFWVSGVESPLIFLYRKEKEKINTITYSKYFKRH